MTNAIETGTETGTGTEIGTGIGIGTGIEIGIGTTENPDALAAALAKAAPTAGALGELAFEGLSPTGCLDAVLAWEHLVRHANAGLFRALRAFTKGPGPTGARTQAHDSSGSRSLVREALDTRQLVESELCAALAWSPATIQNRLNEADALTDQFPQTLQLLSDGQVSLEQARCLAQLTAGLTDDTAHAVQERVIARMPGQSNSVTRQAIRRAIARTDSEAAIQRHQHERTRRRVELRPEDDGMATLSFYLPADIAQMAMRTLTELAQSAKRKHKNSSDKRTLDQRRADLLPVLLNRATGVDCASSSPPAVAARVNVVVGIDTLTGRNNEPGHLDGYGPICADQTRRIAHANSASWRFLLTASDGTLVGISETTYSPRAATKHMTKLKHTKCVFPHCGMPAERCDLDHGHAFHKGGKTCVGNLAPLCRRHHNGKSFGHWELNRRDDDIYWTSTYTGCSYTTTGTRYEPTPVTG